MSSLGRLPAEILAIDWGSTPAKRQLCRATLREGRYTISPPHPVVDGGALELGAGTLAAFDCPIGLSHDYARLAGLSSFRAALEGFGRGRFERFYELADRAADIAAERPFYPARGRKGVTHNDLRQVLGDAAFTPRDCDRLARAGPIFWTLGPRQVGRSAAHVWRVVITPRLAHVALWPFDGPLAELLAGSRPVLAEMYPAFLLRTLALTVRAKPRREARADCGAELLGRVGDDTRLDLEPVRALLLDGFGASRSGEDAFDATIACIALARLVLDDALPEPPDAARLVEGWILGLPREDGPNENGGELRRARPRPGLKRGRRRPPSID